MNENALRVLGEHLQRLRQARGHSLSQLASAAGMAKSNLSRLEQGIGNPTLDTIWRLAVQLDVPFGTLIAPVNEALGDGGVEVQLIEQSSGPPPTDAYWMRCAPFTERRADAHTPGARETLMLISGQLEAGEDGALTRLLPGDTLSIDAGRAHLYRTQRDSASMFITITYH
ncbi:helix-turn-helix domain-containing protein [Vreelandella sp. TE19]